MDSGPSQKDRFLSSFYLRTKPEDSSSSEPHIEDEAASAPTPNESVNPSPDVEWTPNPETEPSNSPSDVVRPHRNYFVGRWLPDSDDSDIELAPPDLFSSYVFDTPVESEPHPLGERSSSAILLEGQGSNEEESPDLEFLNNTRQELESFETRLQTAASHLRSYMRRIRSFELTLQDRIANLQSFNITSVQIENGDICCVCMENFILDEEVKKLPCDHFFHENCIHPWLRKHRTCPICRKVAVSSSGSCKNEFRRFIPYRPRPLTRASLIQALTFSV